MKRRATPAAHFRSPHPLAQLAGERCTTVHGALPRGAGACGACWEHVIRTDAAFADRWGLPETLVADPDLVDQIAVERACAGEPVRLTAAEVTAAVDRLRARGLTYAAIGRRLGRDPDPWRRARQTPPGSAPARHDGSGVAA
jgi:hypothetical protein